VAEALLWMSPAVAVWTLLIFANRAIQAMKDMKGSALVYQLGIPAGLLVGYGLALGLGLGMKGIFVAFVLAHALCLAAALGRAWRHFGGLLRDRAVAARVELGPLLRYSLPQALAASVVMLNARMDTLMIMELSTAEEVGLYRVGNQLALIGLLAVTAVNTMFSPVVAEMVYAGDRARLTALIRTVTRWLVALAAPFYLALFLLPDLALAIFDDPYQAARPVLLILLAGQVVHVACAPAARLIPMGGHAMTNLVNGLAALALNFALNWWLIPIYGGVGAASASALTLLFWSGLRLAEAWWLYRVFPFSGRALAVIAGAAGPGLAAWWFTSGGGWGARIGAALAAAAVFGGVTWVFGRTEEDRELAGVVRRRVKRLLGR